MTNYVQGISSNKKNDSTILDSSLITVVRNEKYNYKVVKCGDYIQVYYYACNRVKSIKELDTKSLKKKNKIEIKNIEENNEIINEINNVENSNEENKIIKDKNILRTKLTCQRLAKSNANIWKSFITLTYEENMQDISTAKKDLTYFVRNIQKIKKDFKYISIIEFQKRGAVHFHLLTNLGFEDNEIIVPQKNNNKYFEVKILE